MSRSAAACGWAAAPDGRDGAVTIHQDVALYASVLESPGDRVRHELTPGRHAWVQVVAGGVTVNGEPLTAGDGAALSDEARVEVAATEDESEILLFDLA